MSTDLGGSPTEPPTSSADEAAEAAGADDDESDEEVKPTTIHSSIEPLDSVDDGAAALEAELERSRLEVQRLLEHEKHLDDASWARRWVAPCCARGLRRIGSGLRIISPTERT